MNNEEIIHPKKEKKLTKKKIKLLKLAYILEGEREKWINERNRLMDDPFRYFNPMRKSQIGNIEDAISLIEKVSLEIDDLLK